MRVGNKQNSFLNGEWVKHARDTKKYTSGVRRAYDKKIIFTELNDIDELINGRFCWWINI
jgi:hypothetical protein